MHYQSPELIISEIKRREKYIINGNPTASEIGGGALIVASVGALSYFTSQGGLNLDTILGSIFFIGLPIGAVTTFAAQFILGIRDGLKLNSLREARKNITHEGSRSLEEYLPNVTIKYSMLI